MAADELLTNLWRKQSVWSQTADRMKQGIARARVAALCIAVVVAVSGALAGVLNEPLPVVSRALAGLAALGAASLPLLRPLWSGRRLRDWTRARSVAEALKSEVYLHLAGVGRDGVDPDAARLRRRTDRVRADGADLLRYQAGIEPKQRILPNVRDVPSFFQVRVKDQIEGYYRPMAGLLRRRLWQFRATETVLAIIGAVIGTVAAVVGGASLTPWIAVLTTIGTAVAVHVAATRYEYQLIEFLRTAERLEQLTGRLPATGRVREQQRLARAAERVISIQNDGWMAKLAEDPADQTAEP